jgi:quercetin dioxygenase-like cupin family protein
MRKLVLMLGSLSLLYSCASHIPKKEGKCMTYKDGLVEMKVLNAANLPSNPGPAEYFIGTVKVTPLAQGEEPSCLSCASVGFQPGARSNWHTHPKGQLLVVTDGQGLIQEWGKPIQIIKKGDVIWTPPDVKHWHGASNNTALTHTAIQESLNGKNVEWMERVTDEQYTH